MVDRAFLLSSNKTAFFDQRALAEANRYTAAIFTAIVYDQPRCLECMLSYVKPRDLGQHIFGIPDTTSRMTMDACQLAALLGTLA
jgi:hypothetical protein